LDTLSSPWDRANSAVRQANSRYDTLRAFNFHAMHLESIRNHCECIRRPGEHWRVRFANGKVSKGAIEWTDRTPGAGVGTGEEGFLRCLESRRRCPMCRCAT
jgi:hypothetical protein